MNTSASTLVATVSINYEDFTEGFLTCGTCLYAYDQAEHAPKLLSCSHTICQNCLELIAATPSLSNVTDQGCIRCPICRQNIAIPTGGIGALPPSFLVNQLFDLVNKKPREFIPKCSVHIDRELLFCETCDCVFCDTCDCNAGPTQQKHIKETCTVIPFSTAIKRMSEILNYRSQQCASKLDEAKNNVQKEIEKLSSRCADATAEIAQAFQKIKSIVDKRETELLEQVRSLHEYKKNILLEQLKTIESEKSTLNTNDSVKINNEADVKNLSKKISDLSDKNETALTLFTPRENCFICFEKKTSEQTTTSCVTSGAGEDTNLNDDEEIAIIDKTITNYGNLRTSKTYPPFCTSRIVHVATHLKSLAIVQSVDYNGVDQVYGGDPIQAELRLSGSTQLIDAEISIRDKHNGTYEVEFLPPFAGRYNLFIYIFNRPIKNCPLRFETSHHHNPIAVFGGKDKQPNDNSYFRQPASLAINKHNGRIYVLDSFNSRIKVLAQLDSNECPFSFMNHIQPSFFTRSCTGIGLSYVEDDTDCKDDIQKICLSPSKTPDPTIIVSDWRNRKLYELSTDGKLIRDIEHEDLQEPTTIAIDSRRRIFVVDRETIFVFSSLGKLLFRMTGCKSGTKDDALSIKKRSFESLDEKPAINNNDDISMLSNSSLLNKSTANKENKNTLNINSLLSSTDKPNVGMNKSATLTSLLSKRCKPKLNGASLQRGSKVVMSAASRIKSTFTLSHSSSLVSAVSLQSMFSTNKPQQQQQQPTQQQQQNQHQQISYANNSTQQQQQFDTQSMNLSIASNGVNLRQSRASAAKFGVQHLQNSSLLYGGSITSNQTNIYDAITARQQQSSLPIYEKDEQMDDSLPSCELLASHSVEETIKPFGIIRGIAVGPDDELIVACESSIRVLEPGDEYVYKRDIAQSRAGSQARLCGMTYDAQTEFLLCLYIDKSRSYIEIYDYYLGKSKFIIDSHDAKLIRPSCLATHAGQYVLVTDLGSDCIRKYRFF